MITVFDQDVGRRAGLERLGFGVVNDLSEEFDAALIDAARLAAEPAVLGEIRRAASAARIVLVVGDRDADDAGRALALDNVGFVAAPPGEAALLAELVVPASQRFAEEQASYGLRLAALGEEIARIARAIEPPVVPANAPPVPDTPLAFDPAAVRAVLKSRRQRDALFPPGTFADPVWDMLLDLTAARGEGKTVSVSSLAIAAAVPATTALRHLKAMADAGLVVRRADPDDRRRAWIDLTDDAFARMRAWVAATGKAV